jgi:hypothetical protein
LGFLYKKKNYARKSEKKFFLLLETPKPPESARYARQKQIHAKLVKSARNPPEIGSLPEIIFARQTTFKSARIFQIWRRKPPSGNAGLSRQKLGRGDKMWCEKKV